MKVTIKWQNKNAKEKVKAICNVELLKGALTLYGVRIIKGDKGLFAVSQSTKNGDKYYPTAYIAEELSDSICEEYETAAEEFKKSKKSKEEDEDD